MPIPLQLRPRDFFGKGSVFISEPAAPGESGIRRLDIERDALVVHPASGVETIPDIIDYAVRTHGDHNAMGWREVIDIHEEQKEIKKVVDGKEEVQKKTWKYFQLSEYKYITYVQLRDAISEVARAFVELGIDRGDVIDLFAETSPNWQIVSHAASLTSITTATAYDTLGEAGLTHSLNEPKCVAIYTNADLLPVVVKVLPKTPTVRFVFYDGKPSAQTLEKLQSVRSGSDNNNDNDSDNKDNPNNAHPIQVYSIDQLRHLGRHASGDTPSILAPRRPTPSTLVCIMYTSGSTGSPKGVCLTHTNLVSAVASITRVFAPHITSTFDSPSGSGSNRYMAYLPLAHVLEYAVELAAIFRGITCGYGRAKTLTDASVRGCKGDIAEWKPTIMFGVPAVWEMVRKGVLGTVEKGGWVAKSVLGTALWVKRATTGRGWWVPGLDKVLDVVVLNRVKAVFGGELRLILNGGAAINRGTQEFFCLAVAPLVQGYGLTETCGMCAFLPPELLLNPTTPDTLNSVGLPAPSIEIKLLSVPDMGYIASTRPEDNPAPSSSGSFSRHSRPDLPQGEICLRGASVTKGYFNRPDLNEDESIFTKDGWLRTGDIGQFNEDGTLTLVDRLKNLVKMQNGEYIAIERLESVYQTSALVGKICVFAPQNAQQPIAIVVPQEAALRAAVSASSNSPSSSSTAPHSDFDSLCASAPARSAVLADLLGLAKKNGFARMEMPSAVILSAEEWTPQNGYVTAAQKLNRGKIVQRFEGEVKKLFEAQ